MQHEPTFACLLNTIYNTLFLCFPLTSQSYCLYSLYICHAFVHAVLYPDIATSFSSSRFFSSLWPFLNTYLLSLSPYCPKSLSIPISCCIFFIACVTIGNNSVHLCSECLCVCPFSLTGCHPESRALSHLLLYL